MLIVHLFVSYAHVNLCHISLPPGVRGWLRNLLVALSGLFCLPFINYLKMQIMHNNSHYIDCTSIVFLGYCFQNKIN